MNIFKTELPLSEIRDIGNACEVLKKCPKMAKYVFGMINMSKQAIKIAKEWKEDYEELQKSLYVCDEAGELKANKEEMITLVDTSPKGIKLASNLFKELANKNYEFKMHEILLSDLMKHLECKDLSEVNFGNTDLYNSGTKEKIKVPFYESVASLFDSVIVEETKEVKEDPAKKSKKVEMEES
jgi:hypothetical protein